MTRESGDGAATEWFLRRANGVATTMTSGDSTYLDAADLSNSRIAVGTDTHFQSASDWIPWSYSHGTVTKLSVSNDLLLYEAVAVNDDGVIVGARHGDISAAGVVEYINNVVVWADANAAPTNLSVPPIRPLVYSVGGRSLVDVSARGVVTAIVTDANDGDPALARWSAAGELLSQRPLPDGFRGTAVGGRWVVGSGPTGAVVSGPRTLLSVTTTDDSLARLSGVTAQGIYFGVAEPHLTDGERPFFVGQAHAVSPRLVEFDAQRFV
ncbi:MAG TPA: hypothetical protein VMT27_09200, partial [Actinomycetes bacterium]|nr:hypothetical protein [Actinomycetes bacterium]